MLKRLRLAAGQRGSLLLYRFLMWLTRVVVGRLARWDVIGASNVPRQGGLVLVANHLHLLDPPLVSSTTPRRVRPMAKRELFSTPMLGWGLRAYGAFPVRRFEADMGALRQARTLLRAGEAVLMFPEGTRSKDAVLHPALPGAAMVALLAGAPVVPVAVSGTEAVRLPRDLVAWLWGRRLQLRVVYGEPFALPPGPVTTRSAELATDAIMRRIASLLPEQYHGVYGASTEGEVVFARQERDREQDAQSSDD